MRNALKIALVFLVLLVAGFMVKGIWKKKQHNKEITASKKNLPAFHFFNTDTTVFYSNALTPGKPVIILFFDPECDFCMEEVKDLKANLEGFKEAEVLLISQSTPEKINAFRDTYHLAGLNNIHFVWDKDYQFFKWFGNVSIPSTFVYNTDHKLAKEFNGVVGAHNLLKLVNDDRH